MKIKKAVHILMNSKWALSIGAAMLGGLSFPPFPFPFLLILSFFMLFRLASLTSSIRETILYAYPSFTLWNLITTYWLMMATFGGGLAAILANSAIMLVPFLMMHSLLNSSLSKWLTVTASAAVWTAYEWLHHQWDLAWPWITLGNGFSTATWAIQYIEFTGPFAISFWTLCVSGFLFTAIHQVQQKNHWMAITLLAFLLPVFISLLTLKLYKDEPDSYMEVVVAQPNYDSYLDLAGYPNAMEPLTELVELTGTKVSQETALILWPENAVMGHISQAFPSVIDRYISHFAAEWDTPIVAGATFFMYYDDMPVPKVHRTGQGGRPFNYYNSALGFYPDGRMEHYNKIRLVPMVERFPFINFFIKIPGIDWLQHAGYGKGIEYHQFVADGVKVPAVVCYDSVFSGVLRRFVEEGSGFIGVITNDGWWGNTSGHIQHYEFARLRAIETRRAVVRSANNGISGMILPTGKPHSRTEYWTRTVLRLEVPIHSKNTFYVRTGEWFGWLMLIFGLFTWVFRLTRKGV